MSGSVAQKLFIAADVIDDYARDYLFSAKRAFDAGEIDEAQWAEVRTHHRQLVRATARIEDAAHDVLGDSLRSQLPLLQTAVDELKATREKLTEAKIVVQGLASFVTLAGSLVGLSLAPSPTTIAAVANAALGLASTVRTIDASDD